MSWRCARCGGCCTQLRDAGHCVLFSSHVMQEVSALCDEVVVIAHGMVLGERHPGGRSARAHRRREASRRRSCDARSADARRTASAVRAILTVFAKEFRENLRERRTLLSALILGPLLGPLLFAGGLSLSLERAAAEGERTVTLAVAPRRARPEPA